MQRYIQTVVHLNNSAKHPVQIGCDVIMAAVSLVIEVGVLAIPDVGSAIDAGMSAPLPADVYLLLTNYTQLRVSQPPK